MKVFFLSAIVVFLMACNHKKEHGHKHGHKHFDIDLVKKTVHDANQVYSDRFFKNDPVWYGELYCKDAIVMPDRMPAVSGVDAIAKYFFNDGKNEPGFKISIVENKVHGGPEAVVEEGVYDIPDGKGGSFDKGKFIAIWQEEGGKWKMSREIWNSDITPVAESGK